jgi:hypothetical protein
MEAHFFLKGKELGDERLLAKVTNVEVVPRGIYVIDDEPYQYTGQPVFIIAQDFNVHGNPHKVQHVEIMLEKKDLDKDPDNM